VTCDVDMSLMRGERRALIGPNGAGKTTFVNLLTGRFAPTSGTILLGGKDISGADEAERSKLGIGRTFQITSLFPMLTAHKNVFLALAESAGIGLNMLRNASSYCSIHERADEILDLVGMLSLAETPVQQLPYGQQRLIEIAIALALDPKVLILDEPAAGIPTSERDIILDIVDALPSDIAVLLIDHDMDLVFRFAQRITVLVQGAVFAEGTPAEIAANQDVKKVYLGEK
jgi:branched-chain amino acid transport system ATP-binding protein